MFFFQWFFSFNLYNIGPESVFLSKKPPTPPEITTVFYASINNKIQLTVYMRQLTDRAAALKNKKFKIIS
ncbi:MAG: hypothetical protein C4518_20485 [Desulfobacteraceae bacterium]|nr:MAG: hypothetical protein C4518_20485 [Desulfobacteraceae bacterium]